MTTDKNKRLFQVTAEDFKKIPGSPIAYWFSERFISAFSSNSPIGNVIQLKAGLSTGDNTLFEKYWFEVSFSNTSWNALCLSDTMQNNQKWYPCHSGGNFRKWYGNHEIVIDWKNNGENIRNFGKDAGRIRSAVRNDDFYFRKGLTWSKISSGNFSVRFRPEGFIFDDTGRCGFANTDSQLYQCIAIFNSKIAIAVLAALNPTLSFTSGEIAKIPFKENGLTFEEYNVKRMILAARKDWDSYETSWNFQHNPLIEANQCNQKPGKISGAYLQLRSAWQAQCEEMRRLEVENNRIFIDAYGLKEELSPEVPWNEITLTCNPWYRYGKTPSVVDSDQWIVDSEECHVGEVWGVGEQGTVHVSLPNGKIPASKMPFNQELETRLLTDTIKELLSYAVGCMFGRYSLDVNGLAYAGGEWDDSKYKTFPADADNIIPICDDDYFEDDLTGRFVKFIETVYGAEALEENLNFIAHALGGRGSAREVIRNYFRNDFFEDHCKVYQKRPIYWLFDSGKKGGFRALIYMHRYQPDTIAKLRVDYVHEQQERYRTAIAELAPRADAASGSEKVKLAKRLTSLRDQAEEVRLYEEKIHHLADRMVSIDLDDGVKHNYAIFQDVLARIK